MSDESPGKKSLWPKLLLGFVILIVVAGLGAYQFMLEPLIEEARKADSEALEASKRKAWQVLDLIEDAALKSRLEDSYDQIYEPARAKELGFDLDLDFIHEDILEDGKADKDELAGLEAMLAVVLKNDMKADSPVAQWREHQIKTGKIKPEPDSGEKKEEKKDD